MSDTIQRPTVWHLASYAPLIVTSAILSLSGVFSVLEWWQKDKPTVVALVALTTLLIATGLITYHRIPQRKLPPINNSKLFFPFLALDIGALLPKDPRVIQRPEETKEILQTIAGTVNRFIVIAGTSGVGKSTILQSGVKLAIGKDRFVFVNEYYDFILDAIEKIRLVCNPEKAQHDIEKEARHLKAAYSAFLRKADGNVNREVSAFISAAAEKFDKQSKLVIIFDQSERLLAHISDTQRATREERERRLSAIGFFLEALRHEPRCVPIFSIRNERLPDLLSTLSSFSSKGAVAQPEDIVSLLIVNGIDLQDNNVVYNEIDDKFRNIDRESNFDHIQRCLFLNSPSKANTFIMQLTGYMADYFARENADPEIRAFLRGHSSRANIAIEKYFEFMINGYALESSNEASRNIVSTVLFTIASQNHSSGRPIAPEEIARLAHIPETDVRHCITYLKTTGALIADPNAEGFYRLIHDQLTDYVLASDALVMRLDHREAVALLAASGKETIGPPEKLGSVFDILHRPRSVGRISMQLILLLMMGWCGIRLLFPEDFFAQFQTVNSWLNAHIPGIIHTFDFGRQYYLPIIAVQILWVSFMYYLDRGYFQYTLRPHPFWRGFSYAIAPVGGAFGCLLVFAPAFFLVPIIVGGVGLAILFVAHSRHKEVGGVARKNCVELATKTGTIMIMAIGLTVILYWLLAKLRQDAADAESLFVIWFFAAGFLLYWFAMQSRLGSQQGWSALLSIYDRGRNARELTPT